MLGIVWYGANLQRAREVFDDIVSRYERDGVGVSRERRDSRNTNNAIFFDNDDLWTLVRVSENRRAFRCNISYVDSTIPDELVENIIKPCTTALPYTGFNYF